MRKKRNGVTQKDVQRWVKKYKEKWDAGEPESFTSVADVPSKGRAHENPDIENSNINHVQHSDIEYKYKTLASFNPNTKNIMTQFPLVDFDNEIIPQSPTMEIEQQFDIKPAKFSNSNTSWVYTEDIVLSLTDDTIEYNLARTIKTLEDLTFLKEDSKKEKDKKKRTWQKLMVQQAFFKKLDIDWKIITEKSINQTIIDNLTRMQQYLKQTMDDEIYDMVETYFKAECKRVKTQIELQELLYNVSNYSQLPYEDTTSAFWQLGWNKRIKFDLKSTRLEINSLITPHSFFFFED